MIRSFQNWSIRNINFKQNHERNKLHHLCLPDAQDLYILPFFFRRTCSQEGISASFQQAPCLLFHEESIWLLATSHLPGVMTCQLWKGTGGSGVSVHTWPLTQVLNLLRIRTITLSEAVVPHRKICSLDELLSIKVPGLLVKSASHQYLLN